MIEINLGDINVVKNLKAIEELRRTGMFTDEELQERRAENGNFITDRC